MTQEEQKKEQYKAERRKVWSDAWCATANANDCKYTETATKYADAALVAFDLRFKGDFL